MNARALHKYSEQLVASYRCCRDPTRRMEMETRIEEQRKIQRYLESLDEYNIHKERTITMTEGIISAEVLDLIDRFEEALGKKDCLADAVKRNNAEVTALRDKLAQAMVDAEIDQVGRHGINWKLKPTTKYSKKAGMDDALFDVLRNNGLGDLIRETVNAQTLQGAMSELAKENDDELPEEFAEVINKYEYMDISHRKASKSAV